ncbi:MAG: amidohydrolase family protein [Phycisphaerales bacterium]|nr:MAG: amidohydrolase family protein [Phycisphaerales bacterium]
MRRPEYVLLHRMLGISPGLSCGQRDRAYLETTIRHVKEAVGVDRVVALAFDEYHRDDGTALGPAGSRRVLGTDLYVSNTFVHALCMQEPDHFLFGASIHPYRRCGETSAVDMLDEVAAAGAVLVKWLPLTQNIRAADERAVAFLRRAGELRMPMLIHYGDERALSTNHRELADVEPLLSVLRGLRAENKMPPVIVAHCGTPSAYRLRPFNSFVAFERAVLGEFADAPLYGDESGMGVFTRAGWLKRLALRSDLQACLVHGSDFPVPVNPMSFFRPLGTEVWRIRRVSSWIERDYRLKQALGFDRAVMTRGWKILRAGLKHRFAT